MAILKLNGPSGNDVASGYLSYSMGLSKGFSKIESKLKEAEFPDTCVKVGMPPFQIPGNVRKIGATVIESTRASEDASAQCNLMDQIWVPSYHSKTAFVSGGVIEEKVKVIPHGWDLYDGKPSAVDFNELFPQTRDNYTFMFVGGYKGVNDRKGLDMLMKAFSNEFNKREPVNLICKLNTIYHPDIDMKWEIKQMDLPLDRPIFPTVEQYLPPEVMKMLYQKVDCLAIVSKAEGYCIPYMEALAEGTPVLAGDFGGHMDYLEGWDYLVKHTDLETPNDRFNASGYWGHFEIEDIQAMLRKVYDEREKARILAEKWQRKIRKMTWKAAANKALKHLQR